MTLRPEPGWYRVHGKDGFSFGPTPYHLGGDWYLAHTKGDGLWDIGPWLGPNAPYDAHGRRIEPPFECKATKQSLPEPADCNWPNCGCDPDANRVIEALEEAGTLPQQTIRAAEIQNEVCPYCAHAKHPPSQCPRIREIEYFPDGLVKKVAFMRPVDYIQNQAIRDIKFT